MKLFHRYPEKVYIIHKFTGHSYLGADFFVKKGTEFEEQGYDVNGICSYIDAFLEKYPMYEYAFSDDSWHGRTEKDIVWHVSFDGWTDVSDWLKEVIK